MDRTLFKIGRLAQKEGRLADAADAYEALLAQSSGDVDVERRLEGVRRRLDGPAARTEASRRRRNPASSWPGAVAEFQDLEKLLRRAVLSELEPGVGLLTRTSKVATLGSCFALHVAEGLQARGMDVFYRRIAEDVNTTFANRHMMDWVVGNHSSYTEQFAATYGEAERLLFRDRFSACDLFIFSLGVAPCFFDDAGRFVLTLNGNKRQLAKIAQTQRFRTTSVDENVSNVLYLLQQFRTVNAKAAIVLTLSPVPLAGTFERKSAVLADAVSKSVLRLAVEGVLASTDHVYYWPSFEIVRWLSGHFTPGTSAAFGEEDGKTRHVSRWIRDLNIALFVEYFGIAAPDGGNPDLDQTRAADASIRS